MVNYVPGSYFVYAPNKGAPIVFAIFFAISGLLFAYQTYKYKCWRMTVILPWGATIFSAGFITREIGAYHYDKLPIFIAQTVLLLEAPPVYAAALYFILGRTLYYIPYLSPIHPGRVVTTFLGIDALIGIMIANGAWRLADTDISKGERKAGAGLIKASVILQAVSCIGFIAIAGIFHRRASKQGILNKKVRTVLIVLYISMTLIFTRTVYRVVEYFQGYTGNIVTHEPYFWLFEASLMITNSWMLNIFFPGRYLPSSNKVYLARDGTSEIIGPGWVDKRPFLLTFFDPFDLWGLIKGRDKATAFWEEENKRNGEVVASLPLEMNGQQITTTTTSRSQ
ncbi:MAG: hypothetical protein M1812_005307 [Candelaria pacifica]|nr:MAG: hypothetical protein M1812_005307 [Candelaria pacifica]